LLKVRLVERPKPAAKSHCGVEGPWQGALQLLLAAELASGAAAQQPRFSERAGSLNVDLPVDA
jgi:hypothetical protein